MTAEHPRLQSARTSTGAAQAALRLLTAAERTHWRGPDPFDALWWHWPRPLVAGKRRRQALIQLHSRAPIDIRIYRRDHPLIPKALGLFASAAARLWRLTGDERHRSLAEGALRELVADRSAGESAWGYWWDVQTRWSFYPAGSPNIVATAFAAHGLQDAAEAFDVPEFHTRAREAAEWVRSELWEPTVEIFAYHPGSTVPIHNASLLGAALIRRLIPDDRTADAAVSRTLAAQRPDGSWPYGSGAENLQFVDSFHTGYVLSCLAPFAARDDVREALARGAAYYTGRFFGPDGRSQLWADRPYPEDAHSAGTGLSTLARLARLGLADAELIERVTSRVLSHVIRGDHAIHRRGRFWRSTVRYIRWCDAHVALGLAAAAGTLAEQPTEG